MPTTCRKAFCIPQGIIVTVLALLFVLIPNGNTAFATLVDMATALYLVMYMLMFAAAIRLRNTHPEVRRTYRVPAIGWSRASVSLLPPRHSC